jgi:hypothetical protein
MSGYHTQELCMAPLAEPASAILGRARAFLERGYSLVEDPNWCSLLEVEGPGPGEYGIKESFDPTEGELDEAVAMGYGVQILQKVKLLKWHYTTMLMIVPGERVGFIWKVESSVVDELDESAGPGPWNKRMKTAVAGYVFGLARACAAEAFVLKSDHDELCLYTLEQIRHAMLYHDSDGPLAAFGIAGVKSSELSLEHLRKTAGDGRVTKHYYTVFDRYTVADFMFPTDKPWPR